MGKNRSVPNNPGKRYTQGLLDRIDNMTEENSFSPYEPLKKQNVSTEEMFGDEMYSNPNDEDESSESSMTSIVITIIMVSLIVGAIIFALFKFVL